MSFLPSDRGQLGLPNVGNSCYLNSTIQCLAGTQELIEYFYNTTTDNNNNKIQQYQVDLNAIKTIKKNKTDIKKKFVEAWVDLIRQLWGDKSQVKQVNPISFYKLIGMVANESKIAISISGGQNDFQEFLILLLDSLHDSLSHETIMKITGNVQNSMDQMNLKALKNFIQHFENDYSIFVKLFIGQIKTHTIGSCGHESIIFDPVKFFPLIVPHSETPIQLEQLFLNYVSETILKIQDDGSDERWFCDKCNVKVNAKTVNSIWKLPKYLIISLGRYQYFPRMTKINTKVIYPLENFDMTSFCSGFKTKKMKYNLYAVSNHFGSQMGGHYTAFRKNPDNNWYHFNDNSVEKVDEPHKHIVNNGAYCLFYQLNLE
jgi:ubiquitin C-terminal hydrolase